MSSLVLDILLWILLFGGVGFGLICLIGLLLFPDTRSRMYTAVRASLIAISITGLAVILFAINALQTTGENQYFTLLFHAIILILVVGIGNIVISGTILKKTRPIIVDPVQKEGNP